MMSAVRIIGREGRNIRAWNTDRHLIIDDTPEVAIYQALIRCAEVARISLGELISDGRIHPAVSKMVEKAQKRLKPRFVTKVNAPLLKLVFTDFIPKSSSS